MQVKVDRDFDGKTVKQLLYSMNISRGLIACLKRDEKGITVNGSHATVRYVLKDGDLLSLAIDDRQCDVNENIVPSPIDVSVLYEDDDMIAVNKPYGMPTHPSHGHFTDTLANGLAFYFSEKGKPFVFRAVNRLDRDTSGVVLVAKNRYAASKLSALMQNGSVKKRYIALLSGRPAEDHGIINAHIRRKNETIILRETCTSDAPSAQTAITEYSVIASGKAASAVIAEPITGRTHQLRVHFSHIGTPILCDELYGGDKAHLPEYEKLISRQALHAFSLEITNDNKKIEIRAGLPSDMSAVFTDIAGADILSRFRYDGARIYDLRHEKGETFNA